MNIYEEELTIMINFIIDNDLVDEKEDTIIKRFLDSYNTKDKPSTEYIKPYVLESLKLIRSYFTK